jgi:hypothetical protein
MEFKPFKNPDDARKSTRRHTTADIGHCDETHVYAANIFTKPDNLGMMRHVGYAGRGDPRLDGDRTLYGEHGSTILHSELIMDHYLELFRA